MVFLLIEAQFSLLFILGSLPTINLGVFPTVLRVAKLLNIK